MSCIYYDPDNGYCKLHSDWHGSMPIIEYCVEGHCPDEKFFTQFDHIRSLNDEELAGFLWEQNGSNRYWKSVDKYIEWGRQPYKEDGNG